MERTAFVPPTCAKVALLNAGHCNRDPLRKGGLLPAIPSRRHLVHCTVPQERTPLLELRDINYRPPFNYDKVVFEQMNFKVFPGEFVILIGENGAGKSTALSIMVGNIRLPKRDGSLHWKGNKSKASKMMRRIGVVMQNPSDYFLTPNVLDELILGRPTKTPADVRRVLKATGLNDVSLVAHPRSLSGGQARRLALAGQLMREPLPELFVLDEPLAGVDWTARRDLVQLLGSLKSQFSIIIVSHEPGELLEYADRVVEVKRGGMHDVSKDIIKRAIKVRRTRAAEARAKAFQDAETFKAGKQL